MSAYIEWVNIVGGEFLAGCDVSDCSDDLDIELTIDPTPDNIGAAGMVDPTTNSVSGDNILNLFSPRDTRSDNKRKLISDHKSLFVCFGLSNCLLMQMGGELTVFTAL